MVQLQMSSCVGWTWTKDFLCLSWLELYLFVLLITCYFHIYLLQLIKTSKIFYFHWHGKGGKLTAMVVPISLPTSILLTKARLFFFMILLILRGEIYVYINYSYLVINIENVSPPLRDMICSKVIPLSCYNLTILISTFVKKKLLLSHTYINLFTCILVCKVKINTSIF